MRNNKLILLTIIASLMLLGSAYGAWNQRIGVSSTISTGTMSGSVSYESGVEVVELVEKNAFNDKYQVNVERTDTTKASGYQIVDQLVLSNNGTIPSRYVSFEKNEVSVYVYYKVVPLIDIDTDEDSEEGSELASSVIRMKLPAEVLKFYIDNDDTLVSSGLSLDDLYLKLNELNGTMLKSNEERSFRLVESLISQDDIETLIKNKLSLETGQTIKIIAYDWSYGYTCRQVTP